MDMSYHKRTKFTIREHKHYGAPVPSAFSTLLQVIQHWPGKSVQLEIYVRLH